MPLSSMEFAAFFAAVAGLYFLTQESRRWMVGLGASAVFYAWSDLGRRYAGVIVAFIVFNYWLGLRIAAEENPSRKRLLLALGVIADVGMLVGFKYLGFFADVIALIGGSALGGDRVIGLLAPLGLSFLTFRVLSYLIDIYRGRIPAERHLGVFSLYVLFFPQVTAGPIQRAAHLLPQLRGGGPVDYARMTDGLTLIVWGLFKKVVIADRLAVFVSQVYDQPHDHIGLAFLFATYCYAIQIYCDFSGYTDMAIGCGRILGYDIPDNFDRPYFARSIGEFWRRWHITLSTWLKDYVYIPLGGSRVTRIRHSVNLMVVFLLCGLWHGAGWTFVVWGGLHGAYLSASAWTTDVRRNAALALFGRDHAPGIVRGVVAFHLVCLAWIFFRAADLQDALFISGHVLRPSLDVSWIVSLSRGVDFWIAAVAVGLVAAVEIRQGSRSFLECVNAHPLIIRRGIMYAVLLAIMFLGAQAKQDFIYFQF